PQKDTPTESAKRFALVGVCRRRLPTGQERATAIQCHKFVRVPTARAIELIFLLRGSPNRRSYLQTQQGGECVAIDETTVDNWKSHIARVSNFLHEYFLWVLLASYAVATIFPAFGLWIRNISLGEYVFFQEDTKITLPMLMLALLLLNAG